MLTVVYVQLNAFFEFFVVIVVLFLFFCSFLVDIRRFCVLRKGLLYFWPAVDQTM